MTRHRPHHPTGPAAAGRRRSGWDRGSAAVELTLLTPLLLALALAVLAVGRQVQTRMQVDDAAATAARAATTARSPADATTAAQAAVTAALTGTTASCRNPTVTIDTGDFHPGGTVSATVTCTVDLADLTGLRLPGSRQITTTASAVLDLYRAVDVPPGP